MSYRAPNITDNFWIHAWVQKRSGRGYKVVITPNGVTVSLENCGFEREEHFDTIEAAFEYMESLRSTSYKVSRKVQRKLIADINEQLKKVDFKGARQIFADKFEATTKYLCYLEDYVKESEQSGQE